MQYRYGILTIGLLILLNIRCSAQHDNVWTFGEYAGLDFNSDPPKAIKTSMATQEGCASICDTSGQLSFYTNGTDIWDRNHSLMPNGKNLPGLNVNTTNSTGQGAVIVPMPGTMQKYYVFSLSSSDNITPEPMRGLLFYSIIDMSLNGGLGDVISNQKEILLDSLLTEQMSAVTGNKCDVWLLVTSSWNNTFKAYNINNSGINPQPVTSPKLPRRQIYPDVWIGQMAIAPNRSKLAIGQGDLILHDFDPETGKITQPVILDKISTQSEYYYGLCFSPDNTKLYAIKNDVLFSTLYQFDLSTKDSLMTVIKQYNSASGAALRCGPDGKIYAAHYMRSDLGVIAQPNLKGMDCEYGTTGSILINGTYSRIGLSSSASIITNRKLYVSKTDALPCRGSILLKVNNSNGVDYIWEDVSIGSDRLVDKPGVYWVSYHANLLSSCIEDHCVDTFKVVDFVQKKMGTTIAFIGMCSADTFLMAVTISQRHQLLSHAGT